MKNTNVNEILKSVSTIDEIIKYYDDDETECVYVKAKSGECIYVMVIDVIDKTDDEIRDFIISEVCRAVAQHVRIHG